MTDGSSTRPLVVDFFRPERFFARLRERPTFLLPLFVLAACSLLYVEVAARRALPQVVPALLDRAVVTESELRTSFQRALRGVALVSPLTLLPATALIAWLLLRLSRVRVPLRAIVAIFSWSGLWIAIGLVAKALLVPLLGRADPAMNVGAFVRPTGGVARALCALTNPFGLLAIVWTVRGLRAFDVPKRRSRLPDPRSGSLGSRGSPSSSWAATGSACSRRFPRRTGRRSQAARSRCGIRLRWRATPST